MLSDLQELLRFRELLYTLVVRDLKARYKNSALGFFWSLLNPLAQVATMTIIFKMVMRVPIPNFAPFMFAAFLPWNFFQSALMDSSKSVLDNAGILKRVYFPREILPLAQICSNLVHFLLALVVLFAYLLLVGVHFAPEQLLYLPLIILLEALLLAGLGMLVATISVHFDDFRYILSVGLNLLFYGSCIFFPLYKNSHVHALEESSFAWVAYVNPMVTMVTLYRQSLLTLTGVPDAGPVQTALLLRALGFALIALLVGFVLFNRTKGDFAERV